MKSSKVRRILAIAVASFLLGGTLFPSASFAEEDDTNRFVGGGYAVSGQIKGVGYTEEIYDATNGLPTSDANVVYSSSDGYIWVGGYSGVLRFDGNSFERMDSRKGLTSGRCIFEDKDNRMWFGTNDNGVVIKDGYEMKRITDKEGLPSLSIRCISQCSDGTMIIGTANGLVAVDDKMNAYPIKDDLVGNQYILQVEADENGRVYGTSRNGDIFCIENGVMTKKLSSIGLGTGAVTYVYPDPENAEKVYMGTITGELYHGKIGQNKSELELKGGFDEEILGITYVCDRIWVNSSSLSGYLDNTGALYKLYNLPMKSSIEKITADYQGNLWYASSRQGVMKVVSSNFRDAMEMAGMEQSVVNTTCMRDGLLYIGTDDGLRILSSGGREYKNDFTTYMGTTRIRCIKKDADDNIWICCYNDNKGLICSTRDNKIFHYTTMNGLINNETRCVEIASDGSIYVGTNGGMSVIKDGVVQYNIGEAEGMVNTSLLTLCEGGDGRIYAGSDGNGIHVIENGKIVDEITREDGLTSEVVLRIKYDEKRDVNWIITSNSIQYMKNGKIYEVSSFPYNNNFDIYYGNDDNIWILSSYGIYCVKVQDVLEDNVKDYKLYTIMNGLPGVPTANAYSELEEDGTLYVSERTGVCQMNIKKFFESRSDVILGVNSVLCDGEPLMLSEDGAYEIPKDAVRVQISVAALDYTLSNPMVRVYLEGSDDEGITVPQNELSSLEYTSLHYGNYTLHMQIIDSSTGAIYQEETVDIIKKPEFFEMPVVLVIGIALALLLAAFLVWRIMTSTVVRRQYREIRAARGEVEKANAEKLRFLANMTHDIRTPINTIMGMNELLMREDVTDVPDHYTATVTKYVKDIHSASEELLGYVDELLDISRDETEKAEREEEILLGSYVPQFIAPEAEVLVVDESKVNLTVMKELLRATRAFVTTADDREECLKKVKYGSFDVVIMETMISDRDEGEFVSRIKKLHPEVAVYALTSDPGKTEEDYKAMGFAGILTMPVDPRALERVIMEQLPDKIMMRPEDEDV